MISNRWSLSCRKCRQLKMALAPILGIFLLLALPRTGVALVPEIATRQSTPAQESQPSNSSQAAGPATDQQKPADQAPGPPQSPSPASQPCPDNSQRGSSVKSDCKSPASPKKHHHKALAPVTTPPPGSGPTKNVVRNGGADDPIVDLSPGLTPQQASHQKETDQLLAASDANLQKLAGRQLNPSQQETVKQIKSYMDQAKKAEGDGDVQRAHNLAVKASLLSADLVGPEKK